MQLYEVQATECNGKPEYSHSKLLAAESIDQAWRMVRDYFRQWYDDGDDVEMHDTKNPNEFTFNGGRISLEIDSITETTMEHWKEEQVHLRSIGVLPENRSAQKKCATLLDACEHVRECLDVGGVQSRQFAAEIAYLKAAIRDTKL